MKFRIKDTKISIFWDITPCSSLEVSRRFGGTCLLQVALLASCFMLVYYLAYYSILKMEATYSSETSAFNRVHGVIFQKTELSINVL
jgi:hypothetical protein